MAEELNKPPGPSLLDQWKNRNKSSTETSLKISKKPANNYSLATNGQRRLWLLQSLKPHSAFYQYAHLYKLSGKVDIGILEHGFQILLDRQHILNSNYVKVGNELRIRHQQHQIKVGYESLRLIPQEEKKELLQQKIDGFVRQTFDLEKDLLLRSKLIELEDNQFYLVLSIHHIIGDRASLLILNRELFSIYTSLKIQQEIGLPDLSIQYEDYAYWFNQQEVPEKVNKYWKNKLNEQVSPLKLPYDFPRPVNNQFIGSTISIDLLAEQCQHIDHLTKELDVTPFTFFLSALKLLLYKYSGESVINIGAPYSNRDKIELENLIGFFNNTNVLRTNMNNEWSVNELIQSVNTCSEETLSYKQLPFDDLVKLINPKRIKGINPLFQVMFVYNKKDLNSYQHLPFDISESPVDLGVSKFDLTLFVNEYKDRLAITLEYSEELFRKETAIQFLNHYDEIVKQMLTDRNKLIRDVVLLNQNDFNKIVHKWNQNDQKIPNFDNVHHAISSMVNHFSDRTAVIFGENSVSYKQLDDKAHTLAIALLNKGLHTSDRVGLLLDRSVEMIIGMLACLKCGIAYIPLDTAYPIERIQYILRDAHSSLIVSTQTILVNLNIDIESNLCIHEVLKQGIQKPINLPKVIEDQIAYIIYTSGSSGQPKGVVISHKNLLYSTFARNGFYPSSPKAFLLLSSFSFDSSVAGIYWTLVSGGTLVIAKSRIEQDMHALGQLILKQQITHTLLLPSLYNLILKFIPQEKLVSLTNVMVAGEVCKTNLINTHFAKLPDTKLYNEYGPTEATVWCIAHEIKKDDLQFVPIGKPIPNMSVYILNKDLQPVPIGVEGELFIGGPGLSIGYVNKVQETKFRFIQHPFTENQKLYRTGDLARYYEGGVIEYLGRIDNQIKIRGFRIELNEINKHIADFPKVEESIVLIDEKDETSKLLSFVVGLKSEDMVSLRDHLSTKLPAYMVPAFFIPIDYMPTLPNGKVDQINLLKLKPAPQNQDINETLTPMESTLKSIWEAILKVSPIGLDDNYFSIGGDSISSIHLVSMSRDQGISLEPNQIFEHQTIRKLARSIETAESINRPEIDQLVWNGINPESAKLTNLQKAFWFKSKDQSTDPGQLHLEFTISGPLDPGLFNRAWDICSKHHDILRAYIGAIDLGEKKLLISPSDAKLSWSFLDWSTQNSSKLQHNIVQLREDFALLKIDLEQLPTSSFTLIKTEASKHLLIWKCHHIFLDGWSCGIIVRDALNYYQSLVDGQAINHISLPNYPAYLEWKEQTNHDHSLQYWMEQLAGFSNPLLFYKISNDLVLENYKDIVYQFSLEQTLDIRKFCQLNKTTISSFFQGCWACILSKLFNTNDIVYGLTVTGRNAPFSNVESIAGLFMNTIPDRIQIEPKDTVLFYLNHLQTKQGRHVQHDHIDLEQIFDVLDRPLHQPLFDSLFVFGNFLKDGLQVDSLTIEGYQGEFSTNYPLTIRIDPQEAFVLDIRFDTSKVSSSLAESIKQAVIQCVHLVVSVKKDTLISSLLTKINLNGITFPSQNKTSIRAETHLDPTSPTEIKLTKLWEELFQTSTLGVHDNFFDLGGKSLLALKLFEEIEIRFDKILPPATLYQNPTIKSLAQIIHLNQHDELENKLLIPMRTEGNKTPLFCLHGGGGHVFFYRDFSKYLPSDIPVFTLQPKGLDGQDIKHNSIEEMARKYIEEIKTVQSSGPYQLLGTCFSNAVALEMANQLIESGEKISALFIVDSGPVHLFGDHSQGRSNALSKLVDLFKRGDYKRIWHKVQNRFKSKKEVGLVSKSEAEKNLQEMIEALNTMYAQYSWKPFDGKIQFIRSSEFNSRPDKKYHLVQWNKLARQGIDIHVVPGHHISLFEEPEVHQLSAKVAACLEEISI